MKVKALCCAALLGLLVGPAMAASVPVTVYISPECQYDVDIAEGTATVDILADIPQEDAIIGFGVDLAIDNPIVTPIGVTIGSSFDAVTAPDGDELAGMVMPPTPIYGDGIVLATVDLSLDALGTVNLTPGATDGDLFEGLMTPDGFVAEIDWIPGCIEIVPEPASMLLLALGALLRRR